MKLVYVSQAEEYDFGAQIDDFFTGIEYRSVTYNESLKGLVDSDVDIVVLAPSVAENEKIKFADPESMGKLCEIGKPNGAKIVIGEFNSADISLNRGLILYRNSEDDIGILKGVDKAIEFASETRSATPEQD